MASLASLLGWALSSCGFARHWHWLAALERIVAEKGVADAPTLKRYFEAWDHAADRTPHGEPIELRPEDFR